MNQVDSFESNSPIPIGITGTRKSWRIRATLVVVGQPVTRHRKHWFTSLLRITKQVRFQLNQVKGIDLMTGWLQREALLRSTRSAADAVGVAIPAPATMSSAERPYLRAVGKSGTDG